MWRLIQICYYSLQESIHNFLGSCLCFACLITAIVRTAEIFDDQYSCGFTGCDFRNRLAATCVNSYINTKLTDKHIILFRFCMELIPCCLPCQLFVQFVVLALLIDTGYPDLNLHKLKQIYYAILFIFVFLFNSLMQQIYQDTCDAIY